MSQILSISKKELRAYFGSPIAYIFLAIFLFIVLFLFFWADSFFSRNIADVRPLFEWMPLMMIFLTSVLSMRLWSEEEHSGTLELLLTLPIKTHRLVIGKFISGMTLVGVALLLTIGLPITSASLGSLDWGPVIGGYLGVLLMASTYLALGLMISSLTRYTMVTFIATLAGSGLLFLVGSKVLLSFANGQTASILSALGTASHFRSIERGVIDLRDLVYYGSLTLSFLALNVLFLEKKRWSQGNETAAKRRSLTIFVVLIVANLFLLNLNLSSLRNARIDLTQNSDYSVSAATKKILRSLDEPLLVRGYFSKDTHQLLKPLVPKIRDLLQEYQAIGGKNIDMAIVDPSRDPELEKEINQNYGIRTLPLRLNDRHKKGIVNAYFHILIKYGDQFKVLSFGDLIEVEMSEAGTPNVRLRNLEYDLTKTIKKLVYDFQPIEDLFTRSSEKIELKAYITPKTLPKNLAPWAEKLSTIAKDFIKRSNGKLSFETIDPSEKDDSFRQTLQKNYNFRPMAVSLFSNQGFYFHLLLKRGKRFEPIMPQGDLNEAKLKDEIRAGLKRLVPGFLKTIGVFAEKRMPPPPRNPMMRQRQPQRPIEQFQLLRRELGESYTLRDLDLKDGHIPGDIDSLIILGAHPKLDEKQAFAIDQYLMRGGSVIVCAGQFTIDLSQGGKLGVKKVNSKLFDVLKAWGVNYQGEMALDTQNHPFPVPVERDIGGFRVRDLKLLDYPYWVDIRPEQMKKDSPVVSGLTSITLQWATALEIAKQKDSSLDSLLKSSASSWRNSDTNTQPDFKKYPKKGFGHDDSVKTKAEILAAIGSGQFPSAYMGKVSPLLAGKQKENESNAKTKHQNVIEKSTKDARLVVVSSQDFVSDQIISISRQVGGEHAFNNIRFVHNLIDWSVADTDLLSIRARSTFARTLRPMSEAKQKAWEYGNYIAVIALLGALIALMWFRRKNIQPLITISKTEHEGEAQ